MNASALEIRAAFHESGHAALALAYGVPVNRLELGPAAGSGRCTYGPTPLSAQTRTALSIAGAVAEARYLGRNNWSELASSRGDEADLNDLDVRCLSEAVPQVRMALGKYWPAVERLAAELLERGELNAREIQMVWQSRPMPARGASPTSSSIALGWEQDMDRWHIRVEPDGRSLEVSASTLEKAAGWGAVMLTGRAASKLERDDWQYRGERWRGKFSVQMPDGTWRYLTVEWRSKGATEADVERCRAEVERVAGVPTGTLAHRSASSDRWQPPSDEVVLPERHDRRRSA